MDLESESPDSEQNDEQESGNCGKLESCNSNKVENVKEVLCDENDSIGNEIFVDKNSEPESPDVKSENCESSDKVNGERVEDSGSPVARSGNLNSSLGPKPSKGFGLKKWRRVRRELIKDSSPGADSGLLLKRRLSLPESLKLRDEHKLKSDFDDLVSGVQNEEETEASVASAQSPSASVAMPPLDPELSVLVSTTGFSIGADSENSDERCSKSSTAASMPRMRHEVVGFGRESRVRNAGGRGSGHVAQPRSQKGRGGVDSSKKYRAGKFHFEKENSFSSVESDLRSSNATFARWGSTSTNGRHGQRQANYSGEHSDDAQASEEVRLGYCKENGEVDNLRADFGGAIPGKENHKKGESTGMPLDLDPFVDSLVLLQAAQEALETEIQKLSEITKQPVSPISSSGDEGIKETSSLSHEAHFIKLKQKVHILERELDETSATVKEKESKVLELESILNSTTPSNQEAVRFQHFPRENQMMDAELEEMLMKKMAIELEYFILSRKTQSLKVLIEDQMAFLEEHKSLDGQTRVMGKLKNAENKDRMLETHAKELGASCKEFLQVKLEIFKHRNNFCKLSFYSFLQLFMLCIAVGFFIMQLLPHSNDVVPT